MTFFTNLQKDIANLSTENRGAYPYDRYPSLEDWKAKLVNLCASYGFTPVFDIIPFNPQEAHFFLQFDEEEQPEEERTGTCFNVLCSCYWDDINHSGYDIICYAVSGR